ncbi:MAG: hypothetical protein H6816_06575 [Phycisphaerales bacterium]|nr:hypothetical protein [Phycisphaerales bacterium]
MEPIQSLSSGNATPIKSARVVNGGAAEQVAGASIAQGGTTAISASQSTTSVAITQQVDSFLSGIGSGLQNNAYLKLLIAALIMQVLLGEDGGAQQSGAGLQGLESLAGGRNSALHITIESSTNTVQMQQQSYRLDANTAVQSMSGSANGADQPGQQMDVTG